MTMMLYKLGRVAVRRRRFVLIAWIVGALAVLLLAQTGGGKTIDTFAVPGVESQRALDVLKARFPAQAGTSAQLVFAAKQGTLADPAAVAAVDAALADVANQPNVSEVGSLQRSDNGRVGLANVQYNRPVDDIRTPAFKRLEATADKTTKGGVVQLELGGDLPTQAVSQRPRGQEVFGLVAAIIVLLVAFGSFVAMGLPIGTAVVGLATSLGLISLFAALFTVNSAAPILAAMIGLGVGIDYALFIVTRHRENLERGLTVEDAVARAIATSGSAVVFAGLTVVIAICGLAIAGIPAVTRMGLMVALAVLVTIAISLTLLPALLGFAGHKIDALRVPGSRRRSSNVGAGRETVWHRWGRQVAARPWRYLLGAGLVLAALSAPLFSLRLGMTDNGTSAQSLTTRRAYDLLADGFGRGFNGPLILSVELDGASVDSLTTLEQRIKADPNVASVGTAQLNADHTAAVIRVTPRTSPQDAATSQLVHRLRDDVIPAAVANVDGVKVYVGGQTATFVDMSDQLSSRLPLFIAAVIGLSVLLLMMVFRSVAVPLKAAAMNLLSIGAAYGLIVAVFQWGWLKSVFGVHETVPIISFMPMMLFAILFGLSMDYEVFLLSRVREEYLHRRDNDAAVIEGIAATARVITSAALIMISVFGSFVLGDDVGIKMFGLGLAAAVLIDATLVRMVLVPATMTLLGDRNWWLPSWLDRLLPNLDLEGDAALPAPDYEPGRGRQPELEPVPALVG